MEAIKGLRGKFTFKEPINKYLHKDKEYVLMSSRNIREMLDNNERVLETVYNPIGLTEEEYNRDVKDGINILVLTDVTGVNYTSVPVSYVVSYPDESGVRYSERLLVCSLGKLPIDLDLDNIKELIENVVLDNTNLRVTVKELDKPGIELVDEVEHTEYIRSIQYGGSRKDSLTYKLRKLQEEFDKLRDYNTMVNEGIKLKRDVMHIKKSVEVALEAKE